MYVRIHQHPGSFGKPLLARALVGLRGSCCSRRCPVFRLRVAQSCGSHKLPRKNRACCRTVAETAWMDEAVRAHDGARNGLDQGNRAIKRARLGAAHNGPWDAALR